MKRRTLLTAGALAATGVLGGCSTGRSVDLGGAGGPSGGSAAGAVLNAAIAGEPDQLDPHKTTSYFSFEVLENVYDTLVEPDENLELQPALAEKWTTSDDQLTWTFSLRQGVTFHDGSPFTADDVVYSYRRIIDDKLANAYKFAAVKDVKAADPATVVITLSQPAPNLLSSLGSFKGVAIVSKNNVESKAITTKPIGTGPFSLAEYVNGDHITLAANPTYWGGAPGLGEVRYTFVSEASTALASLRSGEIQWTDSVPPQQVQALSTDSGVVLGQEPSSDYWYLALNERNQPWNDPRARQAVAYAIDRDAIVQAVSYGTAQLNQLAIPPTSSWYTEYGTYRTDLARAKQLLGEVGFSGGTIDFMATSDYPETVTVAQIVAANLEPLGIEVKIRQPDFSSWLDDQSAHKFDLLMMGWLGNLDPDDFYYAQHHSDGANNAQGYSNPEVDKLLDAGRTETDVARRKQTYAQAATTIADDCSYIYLYNPAVLQVWSPKLSNYAIRSDRAVRFRTASLAP
ncbi:ABC transporter substrate-binding protein [Naumannella cuiyingiana]|uniref:Peptide/nickel transport system substrate-binding protein n=1 Tax=Naumannella cuiyingiana TaxID=1347891 RepID=A0A7Z0D7B9_9ACTN|nr:ABC transporter substrate-binding protein [Naumannella cuiyingiana]NYI70217.1 peptide/nickel transport system substrate-binding protein [Naumannella cuiyingiana]